MTGDFHRSANLPRYKSPFRAYNYMHIHWNDKEAIGTSVPMASLRLMRQKSRCDIFMAAFCDGKESGGGRTLELKAGDRFSQIAIKKAM